MLLLLLIVEEVKKGSEFISSSFSCSCSCWIDLNPQFGSACGCCAPNSSIDRRLADQNSMHNIILLHPFHPIFKAHFTVVQVPLVVPYPVPARTASSETEE